MIFISFILKSIILRYINIISSQCFPINLKQNLIFNRNFYKYI